MSFEWDERKARENVRKHGVTFDEAETVFDDLDARFTYEVAHSTNEDRFMIVGISDRERMLAVWHTYRDPNIRIIGARLATVAERKGYEEKNSPR
ncbi:MAG TPA: BrnT family toxin [Thermoanaerobaculia bacterium]